MYASGAMTPCLGRRPSRSAPDPIRSLRFGDSEAVIRRVPVCAPGHLQGPESIPPPEHSAQTLVRGCAASRRLRSELSRERPSPSMSRASTIRHWIAERVPRQPFDEPGELTHGHSLAFGPLSSGGRPGAGPRRSDRQPARSRPLIDDDRPWASSPESRVFWQRFRWLAREPHRDYGGFLFSVR